MKEQRLNGNEIDFAIRPHVDGEALPPSDGQVYFIDLLLQWELWLS
jgi:hypothetical protein